MSSHGGGGATARVREDEPIQEFMNDVVKCARRAVRDANRREKDDERRRRVEERKAAEVAAKKKAEARAFERNGGTREGKRSRPSTGPHDGHEDDAGGGHSGPATGRRPDPNQWKSDVAKLKSSLKTAFNVSTDGLRVTWHAGAPPSSGPDNGALPVLASKSGPVPSILDTARRDSARPSARTPRSPKKTARSSLPKIGGLAEEAPPDTGGRGALAAADASVAQAAALQRKHELGFDCHPKLDASPLFTDLGAAALKKMAGKQTTKKGEDTSSGGTLSTLGGAHPFKGGGGMVSATDGLKQAILSGKIVSKDGTVVQDLRAELQGPTSWSGQDLGIKYRGEAECEAAWQAYVQATLASEQVHAHQGAFFATPAVARHFLYTVVERNVTDENEASLMRARQRGAMRRFVLNVHQVRAFVFLLWTH